MCVRFMDLNKEFDFVMEQTVGKVGLAHSFS